MKLSIFKSANPHPKSKEEKQAESKKVSFPYLPETVEILNDEQLIDFVTNYAWSPFVFDGKRHEDNFVSCDFLVYDIDEGLTIDQAHSIVNENKFCCLCLPSPSHSEEAHRFRIIIPLAQTITNIETFRETWIEGAALFKVVDEQCKDVARFYFGSTTTDGFWEEGDFFQPKRPIKSTTADTFVPSQTKMLEVGTDITELITQIYGEERKKVPEAVDFFIRNAHTGLQGKWVNSLNAFCFSLSLSEVPDHVILETCESLAPLPLDSKDLYQIRRSIKDGKNAV